MKKLLFVCTGNTCRSPMAELLCRDRLAKAGRTDAVCASAGLDVFPGSEMEPNARAALAEVGIAAGARPAAPATRALLEEADAVFAMTESHRALIEARAPETRGRVRVLDVPDPYGGDLAVYRECRDRLAAALETIVREAGGMDGIAVVPMTEKHLEALVRLEAVCFSHPWSYDGLREELTNPAAVFRVALVGGETAGYAGMHRVLDEGYIANVAVFPEYRRRGVAAALVGALARFAEENGLATLSLEVRASNAAAIALYERNGFVRVGRRPGFYSDPREDAHIMTRFFA